LTQKWYEKIYNQLRKSISTSFLKLNEDVCISFLKAKSAKVFMSKNYAKRFKPSNTQMYGSLSKFFKVYGADIYKRSFSQQPQF
jgi:hypothetical protein